MDLNLFVKDDTKSTSIFFRRSWIDTEALCLCELQFIGGASFAGSVLLAVCELEDDSKEAARLALSSMACLCLSWNSLRESPRKSSSFCSASPDG
jgi:hypothetical protein